MPNVGDDILVEDFPDAASDDEATNIATFTSTTYAAPSSPCGVAFTAPTSGRVLVMWQVQHESNAANVTWASAAVRTGSTVGSGSSVSSATDAYAISTALGANVDATGSAFRVITGLTPGNSYNAQIEWRVTSDSADIFNQFILVTPLP